MNDDVLPVGGALPGWQGATPASSAPMEGAYCCLVLLSVDHAPDLFAAFASAYDDRNWTYLPFGPFKDVAGLAAWIAGKSDLADPISFAILDTGGRAVGFASFMRIDPAMGTIEIGGIHFSPQLQRRRAATEALVLMMRRAMDDWGYRRLEWKCNALNRPSRSAALRLGFTYEGTFRQAAVVKGRNRDTAWFSIIDQEWPGISAQLAAWLSPDNFTTEGNQRRSLSDMMAARS